MFGVECLFLLPSEVLEHPKVKYFLKALKINRPLSITSHNVITIPILMQISQSCEAFCLGVGDFCLTPRLAEVITWPWNPSVDSF